MNKAVLSVVLVSSMCIPKALAAVPFVPFGEIARESHCIYVADYQTSTVEGRNDEGERSYVFVPTAIVAGQNCNADQVTVFRSSDETPRTLPRGAYVLFLKKRDHSSFMYAKEPFSVLRIRGGQVGTAPFQELGEKTPLDEMLTTIRTERTRAGK
jgi:hypothetical protein